MFNIFSMRLSQNFRHCKSFRLFWLSLLLLGFTSCKAKPKQVQGEYIYRKSSEHFYTEPKPVKKERTAFIWEKKFPTGQHRITKEFFRCKGNTYNPAIVKNNGKNEIVYHDCRGGDRHGLPLRDGKEFVYPCLIDLLNYLSEKSGKKVIVTCGHRCPEHNCYADPSPKNYGSKHLIGAEVDFYLQGMEENPLEVISWLQEYYKEKAPYKGNSEYENFQRLDKDKFSVAIAPWANKEILIKLYSAQEGRDLDNNHSFPYISLQVRYDREKGEKVTLDEKTAKNFMRY